MGISKLTTIKSHKPIAVKRVIGHFVHVINIGANQCSEGLGQTHETDPYYNSCLVNIYTDATLPEKTCMQYYMTE